MKYPAAELRGFFHVSGNSLFSLCPLDLRSGQRGLCGHSTFLMLMPGGIGLPVPEDAMLILCGFLAAQEIIKTLPAHMVIDPAS